MNDVLNERTSANLIKTLQIIKKIPGERTIQDNDHLILLLMSTDYFQGVLDSNMNIDEFLKEIIQFIGFESYAQDSVLIYDADPHEKFFIILSGSVKRFEMKTTQEIENEQAIAYSVLIESMPNFSNSNKKSMMNKMLGISKSVQVMPPSLLNQNRKINLNRGVSFAQISLSHSLIDKSNMMNRSIDKNKNKIQIKQSRISNMSDDESDENSKDLTSKNKPEISDEELFEKICNDNKQELSKYFINNILKWKMSKLIKHNEFFGEQFCKNSIPNRQIYVASDDTELIYIHRKDYLRLTAELTIKMDDKIQYLKKLFRDIDSNEIPRFSYWFVEEVYQKGDIIYEKDNKVDSLFLVKQGNIQLVYFIEESQSNESKSSASKKPNMNVRKGKEKKMFKIANIMDGQVFAEEMLIKEEKRQLTAIVTTIETKIFRLPKSKYSLIKKEFEKVFSAWTKQAQSKFEWRKQRFDQLSQSSRLNQNSSSSKISSLFKDLSLPLLKVQATDNQATIMYNSQNTVEALDETYMQEKSIMIHPNTSMIKISELPNVTEARIKYLDSYGRSTTDDRVQVEEDFLKKHTRFKMVGKFFGGADIPKLKRKSLQNSQSSTLHIKMNNVEEVDQKSKSNIIRLPIIPDKIIRHPLAFQSNKSRQIVDVISLKSNSYGMTMLATQEPQLDKISQLRKMIMNLNGNKDKKPVKGVNFQNDKFYEINQIDQDQDKPNEIIKPSKYDLKPKAMLNQDDFNISSNEIESGRKFRKVILSSIDIAEMAWKDNVHVAEDLSLDSIANSGILNKGGFENDKKNITNIKLKYRKNFINHKKLLVKIKGNEPIGN